MANNGGGETKLVAYLRDAHAIEDQALVQMLLAQPLAGTGGLREAFRRHTPETRQHRRRVAERLRAHGARASRPRNAVMAAGGVGFAAFAAAQPDTPGKLAAHAYSYEHLELAAYALVAELATIAGEDATAQVAGQIAAEEETMARRIAATFDETTEASLANSSAAALDTRLTRYLREAHAIETQARVLLARARRIGGTELRPHYERHLRETEGHLGLLERS